MLQPKQVKYRKPHKKRLKGKSSKGNTLQFGEFGLQALEPHWITARQIEAARRVISRYTKRDGKLWIRIFPDQAITQRAAETRMGSGKGAPEFWVAVVKPGKLLYELNGISPGIARTALMRAAFKLPLKTQFIQSSQYDTNPNST